MSPTAPYQSPFSSRSLSLISAGDGGTGSPWVLSLSKKWKQLEAEKLRGVVRRERVPQGLCAAGVYYYLFQMHRQLSSHHSLRKGSFFTSVKCYCHLELTFYKHGSASGLSVLTYQHVNFCTTGAWITMALQQVPSCVLLKMCVNGMDTCVCMTGSFCHSPETVTILFINRLYTNTK